MTTHTEQNGLAGNRQSISRSGDQRQTRSPGWIATATRLFETALMVSVTTVIGLSYAVNLHSFALA